MAQLKTADEEDERHSSVENGVLGFDDAAMGCHI
jgi:hypothetical protein